MERTHYPIPVKSFDFFAYGTSSKHANKHPRRYGGNTSYHKPRLDNSYGEYGGFFVTGASIRGASRPVSQLGERPKTAFPNPKRELAINRVRELNRRHKPAKTLPENTILRGQSIKLELGKDKLTRTERINNEYVDFEWPKTWVKASGRAHSAYGIRSNKVEQEENFMGSEGKGIYRIFFVKKTKGQGLGI